MFNLSTNESLDFQISLSTAAEAVSFILNENNNLKQELFNLKSKYSLCQPNSDDKLRVVEQDKDNCFDKAKIKIMNTILKHPLFQNKQIKTAWTYFEEQMDNRKVFYGINIKTLNDKSTKILQEYEGKLPQAIITLNEHNIETSPF